MLSLLLPSLSRVRASAQTRVSQVNLRTLGLLTIAYAGENRDLPPVLFQPVYGNISGEPQKAKANDGTMLPGFWFVNSIFPHAKFDELPAPEVLRDPRAPGLRDGSMVGPMRYFSDYKLTDCLYAEHRYWNRDTQNGPAQWMAQRLSSIAFPSAKGLAKQMLVYDVPGFPDGYPGCCVEGVPAPALWADLSGDVVVHANLKPAVPNFWHHGHAGHVSLWSRGIPIDSTKKGVLGLDR